MSLSSLSSSLPALSLSIALFIYVLQGTGYRTLSIVYPAPFRYIIFLHIKTTTHTFLLVPGRVDFSASLSLSLVALFSSLLFSSSTVVPSLERLTVKANETSQLEDVPERLRLELRAPIPRRGQSTIDARPCIEKVIRACAVEAAPEKVRQDHLRQSIDGTKASLDVAVHASVGDDPR